MQTLLADALLVFHFAFVLFVVLSLPLVWIGAAAAGGCLAAALGFAFWRRRQGT
jgi:hypothetical protein